MASGGCFTYGDVSTLIAMEDALDRELGIDPSKGVWALVCQGGGGKGAWEAGFIYEACERYKADFKTVIGTSVGALNGALYLQGVANKSFRILQDVWLSTGATDILAFPPKFREFLRLGIFGQAKLLKMMRTFLCRGDLERVCAANQKYFYVMATCVDSLFHWVWHPFAFQPASPAPRTAHDGFSSLHAALLASSAIPVVYPYVQQDTMMLWDGGLVENNPIISALNTGCDRIIVLSPTPYNELKKPRWRSRWLNPLHFMDVQLLKRLHRARESLTEKKARGISLEVYLVCPEKRLPSGPLIFSRQSSAASFCTGRADAEKLYGGTIPMIISRYDLSSKTDLPEPQEGFFQSIFRILGGSASGMD